MPSTRRETPTDLVKTEDYSLPAEREGEQAFVRRYETLYPRLCEFAAHDLDPDAARDAVQRALLKIWSRWKSGSIHNPPDAFYYGAVRNQILLTERSARRESRRLGHFLRHVRLPSHRAERPDTELDHTELNAFLKSAVASLPDRCREVWMLVREHDLSYEEAAAALDLTESTVRGHLWRAKRLLLQALIDAGHIEATAIAPPLVPKLLPAPTAEEPNHE